MEEMLNCASAVEQMMRARGIDRHSIEMLQNGLIEELSAKFAGVESKIEIGYEKPMKGFGRIVDQLTTTVIDGVTSRIHTETKTGYGSIGEALGGPQSEQILKDASLALDNWVQQQDNKMVGALENVWRIVDHTFGKGVPDSIQDRMKEVMERMKEIGFPPEAIKSVLESFRFVDKVGDFLQVQVNEKGELMFEDAMGNLFDANGKLAKAAAEATAKSPDFGPAMATLFRPDGTLAEAAQEAASGADFEPALEGFEEKIESGVNAALDEAGAKAEAHAAATLGAKMKEGVGALGGALSAVGGLGTSVIALGAAWDKPNKGAADYFGLMSQLGGTISQGLGAVDAIGKMGAAMSNLGIITKIGAAAQAVFNAVMAVNPVVLIIIAIVALIAAIALLIIYWDQVKAAVRDNPWIGIAVVLLGIIAPIFGIIAAVILLIAYWDEVKLAFLMGANFMSIQLQKIGGFFVGLKNLIGMVWDWIVASVYNLGAGIINGYIEFGGGIINFFVGLINDFIGIYNKLAEVVPGLDKIAQVERVNVEAIKVATKAVPEIDVGKAFAQQGEITGGLETQIVKQEEVVKKAQEEDKARQEKKAQEKAEKEKAEAAAAAPAAGVLPPALLPAASALPTAAVVPAGVGVGGGDQSIHIEGGIQISINAERLEADSAKLLTDEMVRQLQERLDSLRSERDRRLGIRAPAVA